MTSPASSPRRLLRPLPLHRRSFSLLSVCLIAFLLLTPRATADLPRHLGIQKKAVPVVGNFYSPWLPGDPGRYTIEVTNTSGAGDHLFQGTYTVVEHLPAGLTVTGIGGAGLGGAWSCNPPAPQTGPVDITCSFTIDLDPNTGVHPFIEPGESFPKIVVDVLVNAPPGPDGVYTNCAESISPAITDAPNPSCVTVAPLLFADGGGICVEKYLDANADGRRNRGEPLLPRVHFTVTDARGNERGEVSSRGDRVSCIGLDPGRYAVREDVRRGWKPTNPASGVRRVTLGREHVRWLRFGNKPTSQLCVHKFDDLDADGVQDASEPLLTNWVFLVEGKGVSLNVTSSECLWLEPGTYVVTELPEEDWSPTAPASGSQTVAIAQNQSTLATFGNARLCCLSFTELAGVPDDFAPGAAEPATAPPGIVSAAFDSSAADQIFHHRFSLGAGNCVMDATVELRVRPISGQTN
ncbi:MAG TPA: hypothetical protein VHI71_08820, partial [Actinomycetota bacterium]|nr:hypothetical protein [Actinomycetota bacterium]